MVDKCLAKVMLGKAIIDMKNDARWAMMMKRKTSRSILQRNEFL
jgi:hypothetical protein